MSTPAACALLGVPFRVKGEPLSKEPDSKTQVVILSWPRTVSSPAWSSTPALPRFISLACCAESAVLLECIAEASLGMQVMYVESSGGMLRAAGAPTDADLTGPLAWQPADPTTGVSSAYLQVPDIEGFVTQMPKELHGS
jgi:hypothetical protein